MMKLDHFVLHIDNSEQTLERLKEEIAPKGFPFEPAWGKGTAGFKVSNIWIGRQYFEIIRLLTPDGGGWVKTWVDKYNTGKRGLFCIFLKTDDIQGMANELSARGVSVQGPERISFKALFGLVRKNLPWQVLYLPAIPGTDLEIGFIQYDPDPKDRIKQYLVPNSDENGITGVHSATVSLPLTANAREHILKIFPTGTTMAGGIRVSLENGTMKFIDASAVSTSLEAETTSREFSDKSFSLMNVTVRASCRE